MLQCLLKQGRIRENECAGFLCHKRDATLCRFGTVGLNHPLNHIRNRHRNQRHSRAPRCDIREMHGLFHCRQERLTGLHDPTGKVGLLRIPLFHAILSQEFSKTDNRI